MTLAIYRGEAWVTPSKVYEPNFPKVAAVTFAGVKAISFRFWLVLKLSL